LKTARRLDLLETENAFEVLAEVKKLAATGRDIVSFALGEPDFNTPENIKDAGIKAIMDNQTHYSPAGGLPELREALAAYYSRTRGINVRPNHVVVTPGAKPIILYSLLACVDPGDEVIFPNPGFPIYHSLIGFLGAKAIPVPIREIAGQFTIDPEELTSLVTDKTKMIIINSPHNPTGGVLQLEVLEAIAEIALKKNLWILSDEIYSRIVFQSEFFSIASLPGMQERTIILDGFSKTYAMTGWRIGFGVMNDELAHWITRIQINNESCVATFTQLAAKEAIAGSQAGSEEIIREFAVRRELIVNELSQIPGLKCPVPQGAFYVYPNVTEVCRRLGMKDAKELQQALLYEGNVAVLPGTAFGPKNSDQEYIRLSFATSQANILEGIRRMKQVLV
jgi:aspartate/methionine/tyrosine aminotransferase